MHYFVTSERTYGSNHFDNLKACTWISSYPQDFCESNPLISVRVSAARVIGDKNMNHLARQGRFIFESVVLRGPIGAKVLGSELT